MITRCVSTVTDLRAIYFSRSYENRKVLGNLKTDSNKNLVRSHFFNISFNTTNFRLTTTTHKILQDLLV